MGKKQEEEEEPEGKLLQAPVDRWYSLLVQVIPLFLSPKSYYLFNHTPLFVCEFSFTNLTRLSCYLTVLLDFVCMSGFVSLTDQSSEEEELKVVVKEEHEVDVALSWMEVGVLALAEKEAQGLLHQVFLFAWYCLAFLTILSLFYD